MNEIGQVLLCAPNEITVAIESLKTFEKHKSDLQVGRYLQIAQGNNDYTVAVIRNVRGNTSTNEVGATEWQFVVSCQAVGNLSAANAFERGAVLLPVPTEPVYVPDQETLDTLFAESAEYDFPFGSLSVNKGVTLKISGDRFFSKHIAVVGSTGSGKSCAVARILHDVVGISRKKNSNVGKQRNAHIVIFDVHDEYTAAFTLDKTESFTLNPLDIDSLHLPYWLMNSEELESIFIESNEQNSHNQVSQFKHAVILNKEKHNPGLDVTYDSPVFFSLCEVYNYIENLNREVIGRLDGENHPKLADGKLVTERKNFYFDKIQSFVQQSTAAATKATNGPYNGEFNRFVSRLETKLADRRLKFLLEPKKADGTLYQTGDFEEIMQQFLGYLNKANVTIVDLSGIPFEVLSITVSLISRLIFDFCFHYSKLRHEAELTNDIPVMIVCEEAHNYIPQSDNAAYRSSRKSLERVAKEGRKYGLSLMVVSQRPSVSVRASAY
ncbi:protein of unknown function DUF87 [Chthoniobacter flavus Ellin428]|uniref:Helicase HerA central domain-containing protein n=1 Tax=Chthoniobacter flavus Ellin428 TaxID=497964 RepID=B4D747_9BACT|nr:DUF87 domain-containing protein [Chthoniobacter flavus]EDY17698.1 protein of unknown function DUF87 [Chthoniobacter flavus Ellin428]TCO87024.1 hypothetical protein EV701_1241 [Chthoniobacter flavus]